MGGKIDAYMDIVSPYSFFAYKHLQENREILRSHGVEIEFHPFFLGGVNVAIDNKPPWTVPAKAKFGVFDRKRGCDFFGVPYVESPPFFPILTVFPLRVLLVLKNSQDPKISALFEPAMLKCFEANWTERALDVSKPENMKKVLVEVLQEAQTKPDGGSIEELADSLLKQAGSQKAKDALKENTEKVIRQGSYGSPWMWVRNDKGVEEGFFGSDRFHYMWIYLGLPIRHVEILPRIEGKRKVEPSRL